jgi:hypothetical protein
MDTARSQDNQSGRKRRRSLLPLGVLFIAVVLIGLAGFLWMRKMQERKEFVSKVDAATGYQCRFTMGADWKIERGTPAGEGYSQVDQFQPPPPGPIQQWINDHLLHRPPLSANHGIWLMTYPYQTALGFPLRGGYPDLSQPNPSSSRNLIIDDCPSTLTTFTNPRNPSFNMTTLFVITPDHKVVYHVEAAYPANGDQIDREVQEIIRSFHVGKVGKATRTPKAQ